MSLYLIGGRKVYKNVVHFVFDKVNLYTLFEWEVKKRLKSFVNFLRQGLKL